MPFAAVNEVNLEGRDVVASQKLLEQGMIPRLKSMPGFLSARFLRSLDGRRGLGTVIFETEDHARAALKAMETERPPDAPPVEATALYEVTVEA